jgi:hypothetical protein
MTSIFSGLRAGVLCALCIFALVVQPAGAAPQSATGQHDFDFTFGSFNVHIARLVHPLSGSKKWMQLSGTHVTRKVWNGRANLGVMEVDRPGGHIEGLTLSLYDPVAHQWSISFANSGEGILGRPSVGSFNNGRGTFYDQETYNGRTILARTVFSDIAANSYRMEQAFSDDGGATWEKNWIMTFVRSSSTVTEPASPAPSHDFDFNLGTWKTHISRLQHPLTGSKKHVEYDGISVVHPLWGGRASLFELEASGPAGHIEGAGLRLYNPQAHQWSLNWANSATGTLGEPTIGEFKDGHGIFLDQETYNGRTILLRNTFSKITSTSSRFEQAFSNDYGRTWETNWVMTFTKP